MSNIQIQSGETLTFYQLIKRFKIVIPIIQRDYAQGRIKEKEVREKFLNYLFEHLNNDENCELDFIYGSIRNNNEFIPLDGQQRLTTLFVLHWYLCQLSDDEGLKEEFLSNIKTKDGKSKFYYETRTSSTEFFNELVNFNLDIGSFENKNKISEVIKNCSWYFLTWDFDPTIQGMLVMLDSIHEKFNGNKNFFKKLLDEKSSIIAFKFLNLQEYHLTDDLYIKMNSRGRQLTHFENFKAQFEKYLREQNIESKRELDNKQVNLDEYFSHKIDTTWSDFFWNLLNENEKDKYDEAIMNFLRIIITNLYIENYIDKNKDNAIKDNLTDDEFIKNVEYLLGTEVAKRNPNYQDTLSFYKYSELDVFPKKIDNSSIQKIIENITDILDILSSSKDAIRVYLSEDYRFYYDEKEEFKKALKHEFDSYHKRIMFYAYIHYLLKHKKNIDNLNQENFNQWIRVVHNLTHPDNSRIEDAKEFVSAIRTIKKVLNNIKNGSNILDYLASNNIESFSSWQVKEERIKANLINKNINWKNAILDVEKHKYFNGQIGFILEFSGIWEYFSKNNHCNWSEDDNKIYFDKFSRYSKLASIIFDKSYDNRINNENNIFERAVLTKGDYLTPASQNRKNLLSTNLVKNNIKRDHSWKRLLRVEENSNTISNPQINFETNQSNSNNNITWEDRRNYVKQVFDDILENIKKENELTPDNVKNKLNDIIKTRENKFETWRDYFINFPEIFKDCKQGFIRFDNEYEIRVYGESQSNQYHVELYTYYLFKKYFTDFSEREGVHYIKERSIDELPGIKLDFNTKKTYQNYSTNSIAELPGIKLDFNSYMFIYLINKKICIDIYGSQENENNDAKSEIINKVTELAQNKNFTIENDKIIIDFNINNPNDAVEIIKKIVEKISNKN